MALQRIIIVGGGIGGLGVALGLAREGVASVVCEQMASFGEIGAGIQIAPNAFHCFDALGIGDEARNVAVYVDQLRLMCAVRGEEICNIPLEDDFRAFFKNPYAVVHRAELHNVLLKACARHELIELHTSYYATGYSQNDEGVVLHLKDRPDLHGSAMIGADGLHSIIRKQMLNDGDPRVSGHTTYRSVIPTEDMPEDLRWNAATLWAGPKCHIVHYPLKGWKYFNLVVTCHNDVTEAVAGKPVDREIVQRGFDHVHERARKIIDHGANWKLWVLCDREPNPGWIDGRVALLGDAAHPMLQYFAQGACMALEDGVCLARIIGETGINNSALLAYRDKRFARTAKVQTMSRLIGDMIYHPAGGEAAMRDAIMGAKSPADWNNTLEWIYGGALDHAV